MTDLWTGFGKAFDPLGWSERHWGVGAGSSGVLYALALGDTVEVDGIGTYKFPGIYSLDLTDPEAVWGFVGDLDQIVPPRGGVTWGDVVTYVSPWNDVKAQLLTMTVSPGTGRIDPASPNPIDEIFVGERISTLNGGHYRYGEFVSGVDTLVGWCQNLSIEGQWNSFTFKSFDWRTGDGGLVAPGWCSNYAIASTAPMVLGKTPRSRMLAVDYHMPVVTEDGGASWYQVYSTSDGDIGSSRGLNIMGAVSAAVSSNGTLYIGSLDFGVFDTPTSSVNDFRWLNWYGDGSPNAYDIEIVDRLGIDEIYVLRNAPSVVSSTWSLGTSAAQAIGRHVDTEWQSVEEWSYISGSIGDLYAGFPGHVVDKGNYKLQDMAFQGPDTIFVSCMFEESAMVDDGEGGLVAKVTGAVGKVLRGLRTDSGSWTWEDLSIFPDDPAAGPIGRRQSFGPIAVLAKHRTVVLGAYEGQGGLGGLYAFPSDIPVIATNGLDVWLDGSSTSGVFVDAVARNIRVLAFDQNEEVLYVGSRGLYWYGSDSAGWGSVLRADIPPHGELPSAWVALANEAESSFSYEMPRYLYSQFENDDLVTMNRRLTHVRDIAVDPNNPHRVFVGIGPSQTLNPQNGVWRCDPDGQWTQLLGGAGNGVPTVPATVVEINRNEPWRLYAGTGGQEFFEVAITPSPVPVVATNAEYAISPDGDDYSILAVNGTARDGGPLAAVYVDATALGGPAHLELNDSGPAAGVPGDAAASDYIWSVALANPLPAGDEFTVPLVARDAQWNTYAGDLTVQVAVPTGKFERQERRDRRPGHGDRCPECGGAVGL